MEKLKIKLNRCSNLQFIKARFDATLCAILGLGSTYPPLENRFTETIVDCLETKYAFNSSGLVGKGTAIVGVLERKLASKI